jgi:RNA polymerase sigma factor (sigma-70 family)
MMTAKRSTSEKPGAPSVSGIRPSIDPARLFCEALPFILTMAQGRGFDEQAQRDVAQAVGVVLVERRGNYDPDRGTPIQWAIGIARNVLRETARRQRTERRYIDVAPPEAMAHRPALELTPEERARAQSALSLARAVLTDEQIEIFELSAQEYTAQEIAAILGVTRSRVEQRIREARERLAALLKRLGEDRVSAAHVRGVVLPFVSVDELEKALRVGRVREGVAEELWGGVQDASRVSHVPSLRPSWAKAPVWSSPRWSSGRVLCSFSSRAPAWAWVCLLR